MKNREELLQILKLASEESEKLSNTTPKENIWNNTEYKRVKEDEVFRITHNVRNNREYYYYISNYGRIIVAKLDESYYQNPTIDFDVLNENNSWFIEIKNGYLTQNKKLTNQKIYVTETTDVYNFVVEAGWLEDNEDNEKDKELSQKIVTNNIKTGKYPSDRIEVHHINNNPNDNRIENLIWLPKSIHQQIH